MRIFHLRDSGHFLGSWEKSQFRKQLRPRYGVAGTNKGSREQEQSSRGRRSEVESVQSVDLAREPVSSISEFLEEEIINCVR